MKRDEILRTIEGVSHSQGFYGRILEDLRTEEPEERENDLKILESQKFKDPVELVDYLDKAYGRI